MRKNIKLIVLGVLLTLMLAAPMVSYAQFAVLDGDISAASTDGRSRYVSFGS